MPGNCCQPGGRRDTRPDANGAQEDRGRQLEDFKLESWRVYMNIEPQIGLSSYGPTSFQTSL